jgi:hypothetical protein
LWDNTTAGVVHSFTPDFLLEADVLPATGTPAVQVGRYQWGQAIATRLDEVRCDTVVTTAGGCIFGNYAPTYTFNAALYPQAAAHAWLVQSQLHNHPGSRGLEKPLYYMPGGRDDKNRAVICDENGWAATYGDPAAMNGPTDTPNCDEFPFNTTYNSGGMPAADMGLNEVSSGSECLQTYAYWLDIKMSAGCSPNGRSLNCTMFVEQ